MTSMDKDTDAIREELNALVNGSHRNPFAILGPHKSETGQRVVRTFQPQAAAVFLLDTKGKVLAKMERVHDAGMFSAEFPARLRRYRFRIDLTDGGSYEAEDPYRFPSALGDVDLYLLGEGSHQNISSVLGAHRMTVLGVSGTRFAVWAPNASRVSVIGDFNNWDGRRHIMRLPLGDLRTGREER